MLGAVLRVGDSVEVFLFKQWSLIELDATGSPLDGFQDEQSYNLLAEWQSCTVDIFGGHRRYQSHYGRAIQFRHVERDGTTVTITPTLGNSLVR